MKNAIEIYTKKNKHARQTINRLSLWNDSLGIQENADLLGIELGYAYKLSREYKLPFSGMYRRIGKNDLR